MAALAVAPVAGCLGSSGDGEEPAVTDPLGAVPAGSQFAAHLDAGALLEDDALRSAVNGLAAAFTDSRMVTVSTVLDRIESELGLDPRSIRDAVTFARYGPENPAAVVAWTDWSATDLESAMTEAGVTPSAETYGERDVYDLDGAALGVLAEGTYALGPREGVEAAIDVETGDAESVGGRVETGFEAASEGPIRFAFAVPDDLGERATDSAAVDPATLSALRYGYGAYVEAGASRRVRVTVETDAGDAAESLAGTVRTGLDRARRAVDESNAAEPFDRPARDVLDAVAVATDDTRVTVTADRGAEALSLLLAAVLGTFVGGLGDRSGPVAPQVAFEFDYDADDGVVTVTHHGGDHVRADELLLRGSGFAEATGADMTAPGQWQGSTSGEVGDRPAVTAGDEVTVGAASNYVLEIAWEDADGGGSALLARDSGPDA